MPPRASRERPREVFLSHAHQDRPFASRLAAVLERHGVRYWYSPHRIHAAQQWHDEIGRALARCDWFAVVLSPAAVRSMWVKQELMYAVRQREYTGRIVPLLLAPCRFRELSWTLDAVQRIDFTRDEERGFRTLLATWGIAYRPERPRRRLAAQTGRRRRG